VIVDTHTHCGIVGEHIDREFARNLSEPFGAEVESLSVDVGELIGHMDAARVDRAILLACDQERTLKTRQPNEYVADLASKYPGRLIPFAGVDPMKGSIALAELDYAIKSLGMRGVKILPTYQGYSPSDDRVYFLYERVLELNLPLLIHQAWTPVTKAPMKYQHPYLLDDVAIKFPELNIIVAHLGSPWIDECLGLLAKHRRVYADLSFFESFALPQEFATAIEKARRFRVLNKLFWATDYPLSSPEESLRRFRALQGTLSNLGFEPLNEAETEGLLGGNAARVVRL